MENFIIAISDFIWTYILIGLLIGVGVYFTIKLKFMQFRQLGAMVSLLREGVKSKDKAHSVSSFQAFCISIATRVGVGNMAGVASAIAIGGAGSIFWMWLIALIGSASAFIEATLAQIFKRKGKDAYIGGPAYYMESGMGKRWFGVVFAVLITITFGLIFNSVQSNTIAQALNMSFGVSPLVIGIVLAVLSLLVFFGGVHRIAVISTMLVPVMAVLYLLLTLGIMVVNIDKVPDMFSLIFSQAFGFNQAAGGAVGAAIMIGARRGLFSNEAGMGSAANAAATAETSHPAKQGLIQSLGVFTDTLLISSCTAFTILLADLPASTEAEGINLMQVALDLHIGNVGGVFIAVCIILFAFSSIVGNYLYGEYNIRFMSSSKNIIFAYRMVVGIMIIFGAVTTMNMVWSLADVFMALMTLTNIIAIVCLRKYALAAYHDFMSQRRAGVKSPSFKASNIEGLSSKVEMWK